MLNVTRISLRNVRAIEFLQFDPGPLTWISAENASGKSSTIAGIIAGLGGKAEPARLVKAGTEKAETVIVLDDPKREDAKATLSRTVRADGKGDKQVKVKTAAAGTMPAPQEWIERRIDLRSANPLDFLLLGDTKPDREKRAQWLIESLPISVTNEELAEAAGIGLENLQDLDLDGRHPLDKIKRLEKVRVEQRAESNRLADDRDATIATLRETAPAEPAGNVGPEALKQARERLAKLEKDLESKKQSARSEHTTAINQNEQDRRESIARVTQTRDTARTDARKVFEDAEAEARRVYDAAVAVAQGILLEETTRANAEWEAKCKTINEGAAASVPELDKVKDDLLDAADREFSAWIKQATLDVERAERAIGDSAKSEQSKAQQRKFQAEASDFRARAKKADDAVKRLEALRNKLMAANPLPDASIDEATGEITVNGIMWQTVNTARQVEIAIDLAIMRAGAVGLVCIDGLEKLTETHQRLFVEKAIKAAEERGCQFIVTEAAPIEFRVDHIKSVDDFDRMKSDISSKVYK